MRTRNLLALLGIVLTISGLALFGYFSWITQLDIAARRRDGGSSLHSAGGCSHALQTAVAPNRTPVVGETIVIELIFSNTTSKNCDVGAFLDAAGFKKDPEGGKTFTLQPGINHQYWTISANQSGDHEIIVSSDLETRRLGLHVLSNQFFGSSTALMFSALLSILGPMTTMPWWLDWYDKRRRRKSGGGDAFT